MSNTPRKDYLVKYAPIGIRPNAAFEQAVELVDALERELNAANERIKRLEKVCDAGLPWRNNKEVKL